MLEAAEPSDGPLDPRVEAPVRHAPVATKVQVSLMIFPPKTVVVHTREEAIQILLAGHRLRHYLDRYVTIELRAFFQRHAVPLP